MAEKEKTSPKGEDANWKDYTCPICLDLLIEPVSFPCHHSFCMDCFKKHIQETSLVCPVCRERISNWARKASKENSLLDKDKWTLIKKQFQSRVQRRLARLQHLDLSIDVSTEDELEETVRRADEAGTGELRQWYEGEMQKLEEEKRKEREREEELSRALIESLQKEDMEVRQIQEEADRALAENMQQEDLESIEIEEVVESLRERVSASLTEDQPSTSKAPHGSMLEYSPSSKPSAKIQYSEKDVQKFEKLVEGPEEQDEESPEPEQEEESSEPELEEESPEPAQEEESPEPELACQEESEKSQETASSAESVQSPETPENSLREDTTAKFQPIQLAPVTPPRTTRSGHPIDAPLLRVTPNPPPLEDQNNEQEEEKTDRAKEKPILSFGRIYRTKKRQRKALSPPAEIVPETPAEDVPGEIVPETPAEDVPGEIVPETPAEDVPGEIVPETPAEDVPETPTEDVLETPPGEIVLETPVEELLALYAQPPPEEEEEVEQDAPKKASEEKQVDTPKKTPPKRRLSKPRKCKTEKKQKKPMSLFLDPELSSDSGADAPTTSTPKQRQPPARKAKTEKVKRHRRTREVKEEPESSLSESFLVRGVDTPMKKNSDEELARELQKIYDKELRLKCDMERSYELRLTRARKNL